jgi:hypothetical protein
MGKATDMVMNKHMGDIKIAIQLLKECGVSQLVTDEILHELLDNAETYAGKQDVIYKMLKEKLTEEQLKKLMNGTMGN